MNRSPFIWYPLATAPEGVPILACLCTVPPSNLPEIIATVLYSKSPNHVEHWISQETDEPLAYHGWAPTHWAPLPSFPKEES